MALIWELFECRLHPYVIPRYIWDGNSHITIKDSSHVYSVRERELVDRYHTEEEVYDAVLGFIAEYDVSEECTTFVTEAFDSETLKYKDFTYRLWDHQGKPIDGHKSPYYLEWRPNGDALQPTGWTRRIKNGFDSEAGAYCLLLNGMPYETEFDSRWDYRVVDCDGKVLGHERPKATGELEKENYTYKEDNGIPY